MGQLVGRCDLKPGDKIGGSYSIQKQIGNGAFGNVYKAVEVGGRHVAIKLLRLWDVHPEIREGLVSRFNMEYETGLIDSQYLVRSIDHGLIEGNPYIVMEFCGRGDVQNLYNKGEIIIEQVAVHTLLGLRDLHQHGKVHRDLKPENVLLKDSGTYALTDFGISGDRNKRMTEMNIVGKPKQLFGTYAYMPPEQLKRNREATVLPTTDIFSFGVMMYQLLSGGKLPFGPLNDEGDLVPYIRKGKEGSWDRGTIASRATQEWLPLLEGCLQPNYQQRLQNCNEVLSRVPHVPNNKIFQLYNACPIKIVNGVLLRVMQGEEYGREYRLDDMITGNSALLTMGRKDFSVKNDIEIVEEQSAYISRKHCTLEMDYNSGMWLLRDGQWIEDSSGKHGRWQPSRNGTYVNSTMATPMGIPFVPGDVISIGDVKLRAEAY